MEGVWERGASKNISGAFLVRDMPTTHCTICRKPPKVKRNTSVSFICSYFCLYWLILASISFAWRVDVQDSVINAVVRHCAGSLVHLKSVAVQPGFLLMPAALRGVVKQSWVFSTPTCGNSHGEDDDQPSNWAHMVSPKTCSNFF